MASSIPKFSSFKPKPKPGEDHSGPSLATKADAEAAPKHRRRSSHDRKSASRAFNGNSEQNEESRRRSNHARRSEDGKSSSSLIARYSDAYAADTKGDLDNARYGSLHKYDISAYHRAGSGNVIGLGCYLKINRDETTLSRIVLGPRGTNGETKQGRLSHVWNSLKSQPTLLRAEVNTSAFDTDQDFVSFSRPLKRKRRSQSPGRELVDYRDIAAGLRSDSDVASESDPGVNDISDDEGDLARQRNGELTRQIQKDSADPRLWTELIQHQEKLVVPGMDSNLLSTTQRRAVSEMRLHLFQKAIDAVQPSDRLVFVRAMLVEGSILWNLATKLERWQQAVLQYPSDLVIWRQYIDLLQDSGSKWVWDDTKQRFVHCLARMQSIRQANEDPTKEKDLDRAQIYLIVRLTQLMQTSGYQELAVALWQALIDIHVLQNVAIPVEERLGSLQQRWDDEDVRFGETLSGAGNGVSEPSGRHKHMDRQGEFLNPLHRLATKERETEKTNSLPGKATDETQESNNEDVFHIVFFTDLEEVLQTTIPGLDPRGLMDGFLHFFGLPPIPDSHEIDIWPWRLHDVMLNVLQEDHGEVHENTLTIHRAPHSSIATKEALWDQGVFPASLKQKSPQILAFVSCAMNQLLDCEGGKSGLSFYWLAFQATYYPEAASKVAKTLIRSSPADLELYNAAGMIEAKLGRHDKAERIWRTALHMSSSETQSDGNEEQMAKHRLQQKGVVRLAHSWAWMEMQQGKEKEALERLFAMRLRDNNDGPSAATRLALQQNFSTGFEVALNHNDLDGVVLYSSAQMLLAYLTSTDGLSTALSALKAHIDRAAAILHSAEQKSVLLEALHQSKPRFIHHHLDHSRPYRPADLLASVNASLSLYPDNTLLLKLYARLTKHTSVLDDSLRTMHQPWLSPGPASSPVSWLFNIDRAIKRASTFRSPESVRALFRAALLDTESQVVHCAALWRAWLHFELSVHESGTKKAKGGKGSRTRPLRDVFLAGLRALPWDKGWVLTGLEIFSVLGRGLDEVELKGIYDGMLDRGLRVRCELESFLDA